MSETTANTTKRDEWEIKDDLKAVKRAFKVFKDPERLKDVQELIKQNKDTELALEAVADGKLQEALGFAS